MKPEFNSSTPLYLQIIDFIKSEIVSGKREPGSKVESVRDMAQTLGVNPNTVQRAFSELERQGLMHSERTAGRYITDNKNLVKSIKEKSAMMTIKDFVDSMVKTGFTEDDIIRLIKEYFKEEKPNG